MSAQGTAVGQPRVWTDTSGRTVEATAVAVDAESVVLQVDGRPFTLPLVRLSTADRQWLSEQGRSLPRPAAVRPESSTPAPGNSLIPIPGQPVRSWEFRDGRTLMARLRASDGSVAEFEPVGSRPIRIRLMELSLQDMGRVNRAAAPTGSMVEIPTQGPKAAELRAMGFHSLEYRTPLFKQHATAFERQHIQFQLWTPADQGNRPLPLVVFLHGIGELGTDNVNQLKHRDPLVFISPQNQRQFPCWFMAPQHAHDELWVGDHNTVASVIMNHLHQAIRHLILTGHAGAKVDWSRVYITGLSSGAHGALDALAKFPDTFSAAVAISGSIPSERFHRDNARPVWLFRNRGDHQAVVRGTESLTQHLKTLATDTRLTTFDRGGHNAWSEAYDTSGLARWLFNQRQPVR